MQMRTIYKREWESFASENKNHSRIRMRTIRKWELFRFAFASTNFEPTKIYIEKSIKNYLKNILIFLSYYSKFHPPLIAAAIISNSFYWKQFLKNIPKLFHVIPSHELCVILLKLLLRMIINGLWNSFRCHTAWCWARVSSAMVYQVRRMENPLRDGYRRYCKIGC